MGPLLAELKALRGELQAMRDRPLPQGEKGEPGERGARGERGPIGPQGEEGPQGEAGKDADPSRLLFLEQEVARLRNTRLVAELLDEKGEVKQRVEFGPDKPLRLKLVPVK